MLTIFSFYWIWISFPSWMRGDLDLDESLLLIWADDVMIVSGSSGGPSVMRSSKVRNPISIKSVAALKLLSPNESIWDFYEKVKSIISQVWLKWLSSMTGFMLIIQSIFELLACEHLHVSSGTSLEIVLTTHTLQPANSFSQLQSTNRMRMLIFRWHHGSRHRFA